MLSSRVLKKPRTAAIRLLFIISVISLTIWPLSVIAATNEATDPGGGGITLKPSGPVTVNSIKLALVKQARNLNGIVLPDGSNVSLGQEIYFILYVDNPTSVSADNIQFTDLINESQFIYVPNTLESSVVPSGSTDASIWTGSWTSISDDLGAPDDTGSVTDTGGAADRDRVTVGAVSGQANQVLNINSGTLRAYRFRVKVK